MDVTPSWAHILKHMRTLVTRLAVLAGVVLGAGLISTSSITGASSIGGGGSISEGATALALAGFAALLAIAVLRAAVRVANPHVVTVGARAREHREALSEMAAPRHPTTAGRPLARAPGFVAAA